MKTWGYLHTKNLWYNFFYGNGCTTTSVLIISNRGYQLEKYLFSGHLYYPD